MSFADKTDNSEKLQLIKIQYPVSIASHVHVYVLRICICVYELEYLCTSIRVSMYKYSCDLWLGEL